MYYSYCSFLPSTLKEREKKTESDYNTAGKFFDRFVLWEISLVYCVEFFYEKLSRIFGEKKKWVNLIWLLFQSSVFPVGELGFLRSRKFRIQRNWKSKQIWVFLESPKNTTNVETSSFNYKFLVTKSISQMKEKIRNFNCTWIYLCLKTLNYCHHKKPYEIRLSKNNKSVYKFSTKLAKNYHFNNFNFFLCGRFFT